MLAFASSAELKPEVEKFCENYVKEFAESMGSWAKEDGYRLKTQAAHIACIHLKGVAQRQRNTKLVNMYAAREKQYLNELRKIAQSKRW